MDLIFYLAISFFVMIYSAIDNNIDYDFWARLVVGKSYFQTGELFNYDFQSYGTTHSFIDHEWGSSLIFYLVQNYFGDVGIYILKASLIFLTVFIISRIIKLENNNAKLHFLFFFFALQSISYNLFTTIRCQSFSFLFFALYIYILKKSRTNYRILWTIPILNIIWANIHGGFSIGLVTILIYAIGQALNKEDSKPYFITFLIACLTTLINPYGIKYIYFIFSALSLNRKYITEWQSAFFAPMFYFSYYKFKIFFIASICIFARSIYKNIKLKGIKQFYQNIDKAKYLLIIFMALISVKSLRFHVFFSLTLTALCYNDFYNIFNKKLNNTIDNIKEIIITILLFISLVSHLYEYKFINTVNTKIYPVFCIEFLRLNNLKGNLLTNFHLGSYASYKLYPNIQVYMDGRYEEVYDVNLINEMRETFLTKNDNLLKKYHTDYIIVDKYYDLYKKFKNSAQWYVALESEKFALFLPVELKGKKFLIPSTDPMYYNKEKFKTLIDWR